MEMEFVKEKIKLNTEWLRGLFALFVLIGSGVAALFVSESFYTNDFHKGIIFFGFCIDILLFIIILVINRRINRLINKLKL